MKKIVKKFICGIICLCLSITSCFAVIQKNYWWGVEYYLQRHEITDFRLRLQNAVNLMEGINQGGAVACGAVGGLLGIAVGEGLSIAQSIAMQRLVTEVERREYMGQSIVVSIPHVIQGWNIREQ